MIRYKSWTLTDVASDVWLDSFAVGSDTLRLPTPHDWSVRKRTLRGGPRDGVDLIEVHNGALSFSVLPTRGMGLWRGEHRGNLLGWRSPLPGPVHPKFVHLNDRGGLGWLAGFDELLCRCGLASNGPPGEDVFADKAGHPHRTPLTLHGRIANPPAHYVEVRVSLTPPHELSVIGHVAEGGLFLRNLHLTTSVTTIPGSNRLVIHDVVENRSAQPAEMQLLYHCNLGPPFLEAGSRVIVPIREVAPLTPRAAEGIDTFDTYAGASRRLRRAGLRLRPARRQPRPDAGRAVQRGRRSRPGPALEPQRAALFHGLEEHAALEDGYVTGLEPATNYPNFKSFERQRGRVKVLPPGGRWECTWSIEAFDTKAGVDHVLAEIATMQAQARGRCIGRRKHAFPQCDPAARNRALESFAHWLRKSGSSGTSMILRSVRSTS